MRATPRVRWTCNRSAACKSIIRRGSALSANRPARLHLLAEPPAIDRGELTDKGSINQRAVLTTRAVLVEALYRGAASDPFLILPARR